MKPIRLTRWPLFVNHSVYNAPIPHIVFFWSATRYPISDPHLGQIWRTSLSRNQNEVHLDVSWIINSPNETTDSALQTHPLFPFYQSVSLSRNWDHQLLSPTYRSHSWFLPLHNHIPHVIHDKSFSILISMTWRFMKIENWRKNWLNMFIILWLYTW